MRPSGQREEHQCAENNLAGEILGAFHVLAGRVLLRARPAGALARFVEGVEELEHGGLGGTSQRVVAYNEADGAQPPGALLADLARALKVSADELLGLKAITEKTSPKAARFLKRLQKITDLPAADQRTVLKLLDALHESRQRTSRPRSKARAAG